MGKAGAGAIDAFLKIVNPAEGQTIDTDADHSWVKLYGFTQGVEIGGTTGGAGRARWRGKPDGKTPTNPDADGDGMLDAWETANGLNPGERG